MPTTCSPRPWCSPPTSWWWRYRTARAIDSVEDLTKEGTKVVMGSESVPIGSYTRETLAKLPADQADAILANVRSNEPDVKGIVGKLTQGAADAGFVYVTDVNTTGGKLTAIDLPDELQPQVKYGAGVVTAAQGARARADVRGRPHGGSVCGCAE